MNKFEYWTVAYRKRNEGNTLVEDRDTPFLTIKNSWRYWYADPHLIERDGKTWVFAEQYDRVCRRGKIACCELTEGGATSWRTVLNLPFHLSYPHLLEIGTEVYMIPESYVANEIALYRAESFPDKWSKVCVVKEAFCGVDSTVFEADGRKWIITLQFLEEKERLMLFPFENNKIVGEGYCVAEQDAQKRPAGNLFTHDHSLLRPAQDCTESYGCALNFYKILCVAGERYSETLFMKVKPEDIRSDFRKTAKGIHTYNFNSIFEVIDLKQYEADWLFYIMRPIWFLWRRFKKLWK
ncbi:glucosamine inositolphosphorylceramide transferase family protein [Flavonifractor sp. An52]|uniref:glucosamine inositolphosphorylceramide transferase family protein n=1 Tax=Flavonifractor sp. An52 TaxID=1965642 RepID=UPI001179DE70|nr:hypothetical protein [Flavonifractor sp. An52]